MDSKWPESSVAAPDLDAEKVGCRLVLLLQTLFLAISLVGLDAPFLSTHHERQNETFDMARHVFHEGWSAVVAPKASFSLPGCEQQPFTLVQQEVPFHGLLGWPLAILTGHERAAVRIVSIAFALASIQLLYRILRHWLDAKSAAAGAAVWATAPLVLQFGQVPMPDILATTGMLCAFLLALRGKLSASSACFLFAILSKASVIPFGLPVLTALLVSRNCRSPRELIRHSLLWGALPLCGLIAWTSLELNSPPTPNQTYTTLRILAHQGNLQKLISPSFYIFILGCLVPFGAGVLGMAGFAAGLKETPRMSPWIKWAVIASNVAYLYVVQKVTELQYLLASLVWVIVGASFGFPYLMGKVRAGGGWRAALGVALGAHLTVAGIFVWDLKASRVPDYAELEHVSRLLPAEARVVVVYRYFGASATVWLNRNVVAFDNLPTLEGALPGLRPLGFSHILVLEVESRHGDFFRNGLAPSAARLLHLVTGRSTQWDTSLGNGDSLSPFRQYCNARFSKVFETPHFALYSLSGTKTNARLPAGGHPQI